MNTEIHYLAGFFDGEGSIGLYTRSSGGIILKTTVGNTFKPACDMYYNYFKRGVVGESPVTGNRKRKWRWEVSALDAVAVLTEIRPFLREKGEQADVALEYYEWRKSQPHYGFDWTPAYSFIDKLKRLKRLPSSYKASSA